MMFLVICRLLLSCVGSEQALNGIFRPANHIADGVVGIYRFGWSILPRCSGRIYRDVVSHHS